MRKILFYILLGNSFFLTGCAVFYGPKTPYSAQYEGHLKRVQLPESDEIEKAGTTWVFSKSPEEVWEALQHIIPQYEGILRIDSKNPEDRRFIFVHGRQKQLQTPRFKVYANMGMVFTKFLDTWLAVSLRPADDGHRTMLAVAYMSADGKVIPALSLLSDRDKSKEVQEQLATSSDEKQVNEIGSLGDVLSGLSQLNANFGQNVQMIKKPEERWKYVPQETINEFLYVLGTQLYGPEHWKEKFVKKFENIPIKKIPDIKYPKLKENREVLMIEAGNWTSAQLRRTIQVVHAPEVIAAFQEMMERLKKAAKQDQQKINIYIIASPEVNAFALPNGDIFICSGLLEVLESPDQVAAVLGHEVDHVFSQDAHGALQSAATSQNIAGVVSFAGQVGGGALGGVAALGAEVAPTIASSIGQHIMSNVIINTVSVSVQSLGGAFNLAIGSAIVSGYSQEAELRADANGARYVWAAGYNIEEELQMLQKLEGYQKKANERKELITSGFINCKPGLEKRINNLQEVISKLK
jgi:Zn-dependent protease with chaperone function